ncbi:type I polyketide synthase, partial [Streptomyces sp. IMTB 2501]|uniref:type I polyketide synthase n=1 Tax=Streptomyces sp. IMTB 2501 TaxID=1776340 RepID=UPI00117D47D5
VDAVEAHGTGTKLGDPIEAQALIAVYGQDRPADRPLWLGSLKSNIGHSVAAAGVGGVIKMVMALRREELPRTLHVEEPSPLVDWSAGAVGLLTEPVAWPRGERVRRAGVSSFGASGTNAHVIVEEAPALEPESADEGGQPGEFCVPVVSGSPVPWVVSAGSAGGLRAQAARLRDFAEAQGPGGDLAAVGRALTTRCGLGHRLVVLGEDHDELLAGLQTFAEAGEPVGGAVSGVASGTARPVLVFPGQGWQWAGMGAELLEASPAFAAAVRECSAVVEELAGWSVVDVLTGVDSAPSLERVDVVQPVMFTVMVGLARLWESVGVRPQAVVGHSQGEIAAACVAGVLSVADAVRVVVARSAALVELAGQGAMLSVAAGVDAVTERLGPWEGRLCVAAVNGPSSTVVAGEVEAAEMFLASCAEAGVRARRIPVDYASHTPQVEAIGDRILAALDGITPREGRIPLYSTVTGKVIDGSVMNAGYWLENLSNPVRFEDATKALLDDGFTVFIEASAHPVLTVGINETVDASTTTGTPVAVTGTLRRGEGGPRRFIMSAAHAWAAGLDVAWADLLPVGDARVELPTYAFDRTRYWLDRRARGDGNLAGVGLGTVEHGLLAASLDVASAGTLVLSGRLSLATQPWLADHTVAGTVLLPGTAFVDLVIRAGDEVGCGRLQELVVQSPLVVPAQGAMELQVVVDAAEDDGGRGVGVYARPQGAPGEVWTRHAQARVVAQGAGSGDGDAEIERLRVWPPEGASPVAVGDSYGVLADRGYGYGPAFQGLRSVWRGADGEVYAEAVLPDVVREDAGRFGIHPALLDAVLHAQQFDEGFAAEGVWLPFSWSGVSLLATGASALKVVLRRVAEDTVRITAVDPAGEPVVQADAMRMRRADPSRLTDTTPGSDGLFAVEWFPAAVVQAAGPGSVAVLGADPVAVGAGVSGVVGYADVLALAAALDAGAALPECVLVTV